VQAPHAAAPIAGQLETQAEECCNRAITVARAQQAKSWELRAVTSLACLYRYQGKHADVGRIVSPLLDWFTEGQDTVDVQAARAIVRSGSQERR
jgi:hypothetical protein